MIKPEDDSDFPGARDAEWHGPEDDAYDHAERIVVIVMIAIGALSLAGIAFLAFAGGY